MSASVRECVSGCGARLRLVLAAAVAAVLLGGCGAGCADEVVQHEPSPYGRGAAMVFVRACGDATDPSTQVALVGHVDAEPRKRNVFFVADTNDGRAPAGPDGAPQVRVRWIDGNHLEVAHHPRVRTLQQEPAHASIRITYVPLP